MRWPWTRTETRARMLPALDLSRVDSLGGDPRFGQAVNAVTIEALSAATAAIDAVASTIGSLPAYVFRLADQGREEDPGHPLMVICRDGFNPDLTAADGWQWLVAECLRNGNAVLEKIVGEDGALRGLRPIPWHCVSPKVLPEGRLIYEISEPSNGQRRRLLDTELLHLRDRSDDGLIGRARHERAAPVIGSALALQEFAGNSMKNGAYPSGVFETPAKISEQSVRNLRDYFSNLFSGPTKAAKAMVLDQGLTFKPLTGSPEDMELLAARRFAIEEVARLYGVPPPIIGDLSHGTFTNSETLIRFFAQSTIATWCRKIEAEVHRSIFTASTRRTHKFEFDLSGLLRGDPETRWRSHEIAVRNGILTPNEVREVEGWNPLSASAAPKAGAVP